MDIRKVIESLTLLEKAQLVAGRDFMFTKPLERLGVPSIRMSDGPHGLRMQIDMADNGSSRSEPSTDFPTASCSANSWNPILTYKMGEAIAEECRYYGVNVLLGPGANIKRNPLCGRNFEYFSEDPLLSSEMAIGAVKGLQDNHVGASLKHFALNNLEKYRSVGNSLCDERAMREIYLKSFERVVKLAKPYTLMCAYQQINNVYCSDNKWLLNDVLRDDWKYEGLVMTDWGATHNRVDGLKAGQDLEMPGDTDICVKWIIDAINNNELDIKELDKAVYNVLNLVNKFEDYKRVEDPRFKEHSLLAEEIALESAVLLKNENNILPLKEDKKYLVVGDLFIKMRYQGAGSSIIKPTELTTPKDAFELNKVNYDFVKGYSENKLEKEDDLIAETIKKAENYTDIIVFAGLTDYVEGEATDRKNLSLPNNQIALIEELSKLHKNIVVVLFGGGVIELPFEENVQGIIDMFLPGQSGGSATYKLLFGKVNPSGKLAETWPLSYNDVPFGKEYTKSLNEIYKESIYVGYRYYSSIGKKVRYPFGYGLSYTSFEYSNLKVSQINNELKITYRIKNTGKVSGKEISQIYVEAPKSNIFKPIRELRGFNKANLEPGEEKEVSVIINNDDLRYYNISTKSWALESGNYIIQVASNVNDIKLSQTLNIVGEDIINPYSENVFKVYNSLDFDSISDELWTEMSKINIKPVPPIKPISVNSIFSNMKQTFFGKILYNAVMNVQKKAMKEALAKPEGYERDNAYKGALFLENCLNGNSITTMTMCSGKTFPYNMAEGFVNLANGHILKGIYNFTHKIKIPEEKEK